MKEENNTDFFEALKKFTGDPLNKDNGRYRSWEHCYYIFNRARNNNARNNETYIDYLSLHLAFYLASWGMYRGSSFLLKRDYKTHEEAVKIILEEKYDKLCGIECSKLKDKKYLELLFKLSDRLNEYYTNIRNETKTDDKKDKVSDTLITKILMGTMGCVPAYDRYFVAGIRKQHVATGNFNEKSVISLIEFYENLNEKLEIERRKLKIKEMLEYPQMKMLDMGFWQIGYDLDSK